jgi:hypothetical protein
LIVAIGMALAFAFTNGVHDAANAIATLVATRAARPAAAGNRARIGEIVLSSPQRTCSERRSSRRIAGFRR